MFPMLSLNLLLPTCITFSQKIVQVLYCQVLLLHPLVNVVYGYTDTLSEYSASTIGYGALGETNVFGCHPFTSTKDTCTFSLSL
jgi:hypothetical protein